MMRLGSKVIIVGDKFEQNLPVGDHGFVIAYDRNADNAFDYVVRIPALNKHVFVPKEDIELEEALLQKEAERIEREALIDFALATRNESLFKKLMNGGAEEQSQETSKDSISSSDFVKQVNLRAWI
ncbi:ATPase [Paenibacillus alkalitolerans]|uniref:ATPase n=1 Tax=Paenibacillus alkalitolerans TaxID=2799335 RepID=UPI0018F315F8|nr:ATPase [Paenibacillus alkalitolerans]